MVNIFTVFEVGGDEYHFEYTANSICEVEKIAGCGLSELMKKGEVSGVRLLIWAGLLHDVTITLEQAGEFMDRCIHENGSLLELCNAIQSALEMSGFVANNGIEMLDYDKDMEQNCRAMAIAFGEVRV